MHHEPVRQEDRLRDAGRRSCGNELQAFKDLPKEYDAWNIDPGTLDKPPVKLIPADSVELVEKGPLRAVIRVTHHRQNSKFVQDIILTTGADEVVVVNDIDWHETHVLLKAAFPLAASSAKATYEIPFGTIERPTTRNNSWEKARFEVPAQRWADLGDGQHGFSLINDSKFGYDARRQRAAPYAAALAHVARSRRRPRASALQLCALSAWRRLEAGAHRASRIRLQLQTQRNAGGSAHRRDGRAALLCLG